MYDLVDKPTPKSTCTPRIADRNVAPSDRPPTAPPTPVADIEARGNIGASLCTSPVIHDQPMLSASIEDIHMHTDSFPWLDNLNWDGNDVPWADPAFEEAKLNPIVDPSPPSDESGCLSAFPGLLDWTPPAKDAGGDNNNNNTPEWTGHPTAARDIPPPHGYSDNTEPSSVDTDDINGNNDSEMAIPQLSQLSMRLCRLRRLADDLAATVESSNRATLNSQTPPKPVIDDTTFKSVAAWVAHGSGQNDGSISPHSPESQTAPPETNATGTVLYHLLSASHTMLEILRQLHMRSALPSPPISGPPTCLPSPVNSHKTPSDISASSRPSSEAVRHLVITCHTVLTSVYVSVLKTLEHDARLGQRMDVAAVGDIRLVSVVQLCSYLTERQHQSMSSFMSNQGTPPMSPWQGYTSSTSHQSSQAFPDEVTREELKDLRMEVQQRLARLQKLLGF